MIKNPATALELFLDTIQCFAMSHFENYLLFTKKILSDSLMQLFLPFFFLVSIWSCGIGALCRALSAVM